MGDYIVETRKGGFKVSYCPNCGFDLGSIPKKLEEDTSSLPKTPQNRLHEVSGTEESILSDYLAGNAGLAVPKVSDYRERYKKHQLRASDVKTSAPIVPLVRMDSEMDKFGDLVIGEGIEQEV
jgi:hypothetical protein